MSPTPAPVLSVRGLSTTFDTDRGPLTAVADASLDVRPGEAVGLVGESGSGKSVLIRSAMGLVGPHTGARREGTVLLEQQEISALGSRDLRKLWGSRIAMVLQDPLRSLNPVRTIGAQLVETLRRHHRLGRRDARARAMQLLREVGIADPERRLDVHPHEMSGGMRQRVMIAMALAGDPAVLVADEPTTALDVTVQHQILELLDEQRLSRRMGLLLVTHDLSIVAARTDRVVVMYAGQVVETAPTVRLFASPGMPYTRALLDAVPPMSGPTHVKLAAIPGAAADLLDPGSGCRFADRCALARDRCHAEQPQLVAIDAAGEHQVRCHYPLAQPEPATPPSAAPTATVRTTPARTTPDQTRPADPPRSTR